MFTLFLGIKLSFIGKLCAGIGKGIADEAISTFTDTEMSLADDIKEKVVECRPWSDHMSVEGMVKLAKALKEKDEFKAKFILEKYKTETAAPWCIITMRSVIVLVCTKCPTMLKEALPTHYL